MLSQQLHHCQYYCIFVDDYSRFTWYYTLQHKDQLADAFKHFKARIENESGTKIKILHTDHGGEFISNSLQKYLKEHGIIHRTSAPYTPEQNGTAERMNRTIMESARAMLFQTNINIRFWPHACATSVHIKNRLPHSSLNGITPYEKFHNKAPTIDHLKVFGCKAYLLKQTRTKLDRKSDACIFVTTPSNTILRLAIIFSGLFDNADETHQENVASKASLLRLLKLLLKKSQRPLRNAI